MNAVATFGDLKGTDGENALIVPNIVFCVTTLPRDLPVDDEDISPDLIKDALQEQSMWIVSGEAENRHLVNVPPLGFEADPPITVNEQVLGHLKGCGVLTAAAAPIAHAGMKFPTGCLVWARDLKAFIPMDELVAPSQHPRAPHTPRRELPEDGRTVSSHASQRSQYDSPVDSPRHGADRAHHGRHGADRDHHGRLRNEVTMNHTQALEQQAFAQARGAFDVRALEMYEIGSRTAQQTLTAISQAAEVHFIDQLQIISANWTPARFRAWALCDFRPASFAGTSTSCRLSWFSPTGKITDAATLWTAVAIWTDVEMALRGNHMKLIVEAHRALTLIDVKRNGKMGWPSIMHLLEARAMRLRSPPPARLGSDSCHNRAVHAFTVKPDDRDVKQVCDVPIIAPITVRVREERPDREQRPKRHQPTAAPTPAATGVPARFLALENVCYEWTAAGMPEIAPGAPCPSNAGSHCQWEHRVDPSVPDALFADFTAWCRKRTSHHSGASSAAYAHRAAKRRGRGRP